MVKNTKHPKIKMTYNHKAVNEDRADKTFTVTWLNYDGSVLKVDHVPYTKNYYGYIGEIPKKESDSKHDYLFEGWSSKTNETTRDITYIACFSIKVNLDKFTFAIKEDENGQYASLVSFNLYTDEGDYNDDILDVVDTEFVDTAFEVIIPATVIVDGVETPVKEIGRCSFDDCIGLTSVVIPNGITSIGIGAFYSCDSLVSVVIPSSVTSVGALAFEDCFSLTSVVILGRITTLDFGVFYACTSLTLIEIPNSVTSIDNEAFYDCSSLTSIVISSSVSYIGERAFEGCSSLTIYCEADSKPKGWNADWNISNCPVYWKGEWTMTKNGPKPLNK